MSKTLLSSVLENLSEELWKANERAIKSGKATMQFSECEIELGITTEQSGGAGVQIYVVNLGGDIKRSETNTIKIKFVPIAGQTFINQVLSENAPAKYERRSRKKTKDNKN